MRCQCCNRNLSDYESTLRHPDTLEFLDICKKCLEDIPIKPVEGCSFDEGSYEDDAIEDSYEQLEEDDEE